MSDCYVKYRLLNKQATMFRVKLYTNQTIHQQRSNTFRINNNYESKNTNPTEKIKHLKFYVISVS